MKYVMDQVNGTMVPVYASVEAEQKAAIYAQSFQKDGEVMMLIVKQAYLEGFAARGQVDVELVRELGCELAGPCRVCDAITVIRKLDAV